MCRIYRAVVGLLFLELIAATFGCLRTSQERYATALIVLDQEEKRLQQMQPAFDRAYEQALNVIVKEGMATTDYTQAKERYEKGTVRANTSIALSKAGVDYSSDRLKEGREIAENLIAAHDLQEWEYVQEIVRESKSPGTKRNQQMEQLLSADSAAKEYRAQEDRVLKAKVEVDWQRKK